MAASPCCPAPELDIDSCRAWNEKLPVHLPSEILVLIFLSTQNAVPTYQKGHVALVLSWVCHHWRATALFNQDLWNIIDFKNPNWVQESLTRSGASNLSVYVKEYRGDICRIIPLLLTKLPRITVLHLYSSGTAYGDSGRIQLDDSWAQSAPFLTDLSLYDFDIPANIFPAIASALRHLRVEFCTFDVNGLRGLNLVTLSLTHLDGPTFTPDELLVHLQDFPELEELELENVMDEGTHPLSERVSLPRLWRLSLMGTPYETLSHFIDSISFPNDVDLTVFVDDATQMSLLVTSLRNCSGGDQWKLNSAVVTCDLSFISFELSRIVSGGRSQSVYLPFSWNWTRQLPGALETNNVLMSFDISALVHLELSSHEDDVPSGTWEALFNRTLALQELLLYGGYSNSLLRTMVPADLSHHVGQGQPPQNLQYPPLKLLKLQRASSGWNDPRGGPFPADPVEFVEVMRRQQTHGLMLSTMITIGYQLPTEVVQSLEEVVGRFQYHQVMGNQT